MLPYCVDSFNDCEHEIYREGSKCAVCKTEINIEDLAGWLSCKACPMISHILCLSDVFLKYESELSQTPNRKPNLIPVHGLCPLCKTNLKWGSLITSMKLRIDSDKTSETAAAPNIISTFRKIVGQHAKKSKSKIRKIQSFTDSEDSDHVNTDGDSSPKKVLKVCKIPSCASSSDEDFVIKKLPFIEVSQDHPIELFSDNDGVSEILLSSLEIND